MKKRRAAAVIFAWWLMLFWAITVSAADSPRVFSEPITVQQGTQFTIPIKLENNSGLMGFKISVQYPADEMDLKDISSGSLTREGLFDSTVTDFYSVNGMFDVVWSSTHETKDDGTLMMLTFVVHGIAEKGEHSIALAYSAQDTFNEAFEPVALQCEPITVRVTDTPPNTTVVPDTSGGDTDGKPVSDDYLVASVNAVVQSFGGDVHALDETQQKTVVDFVNSRNKSYDPDAVRYGSFDSLSEAYRQAADNEAKRLVLESTDGDKILSAAQAVLQTYHASAFAEVDEADRAEAVQAMQEKLTAACGDTRGFASVEDAAGVLDSIVAAAQAEDANSKDVASAVSQTNSVKPILWIILGAVAVVIVVGTLIVILRIKKRRTKTK